MFVFDRGKMPSAREDNVYLYCGTINTIDLYIMLNENWRIFMSNENTVLSIHSCYFLEYIKI